MADHPVWWFNQVVTSITSITSILFTGAKNSVSEEVEWISNRKKSTEIPEKHSATEEVINVQVPEIDSLLRN